jgi:CHAD domain-containing protein
MVDERRPEEDPVAPVRGLSFLISEGSGAETAEENALRAEQELKIAHDYDTADRDLERLGMRIQRLPLEAGVMWRLTLPRGEQVEAWEPGNRGLQPPVEITTLLDAATAGKQLHPTPPASSDPGAIRLRELLQMQRRALLVHDPGARLGEDPENVHNHRIAARRTRAFLSAARDYLDPDARHKLIVPLDALGRATGPMRDLDVLLAHLRVEVQDLGESDRLGAESLLAKLEVAREDAARALTETLGSASYRSLLTRLNVPLRLAAGVESVPVAKIARKEFRRLVKGVERLGKNPDEAQIHGLRIRLKRARYAAELSAPDDPIGRRFLADAKILQELLGEHQDAVVAEQQLRAAVVSNSSTHAAFVAGRLAERQRARRLRVSESLPSAWKRLRRSGSTWRD